MQWSSTSNPLERESTAADSSGAAAVAAAATPSAAGSGVGREGAKNSANGEWPGAAIGRRAWPRWKGVESDGGARAPKNRCPSTAAGSVGYDIIALLLLLLLLLSSSSVCVCVCVWREIDFSGGLLFVDDTVSGNYNNNNNNMLYYVWHYDSYRFCNTATDDALL